MKKKKKSTLGNYIFLLPAFLIYVTVIIVPTLYSFGLSLFKWNGIGDKAFVGLANYKNMVTDKIFLTALKNNIIWIILTMTFTILISLGLALLLNRKFFGRTFFRGLFYFPFTLSGIVVSLVWSWIYHPSIGFLNSVLQLLGKPVEKGWLSDPSMALYLVFIAACWQGIGQPLVLFLSGLQTVPEDIMEAAKIDGVGKISGFFRITVPLMKETFVIVFATLIISAMKVYDIVYGMTGGGPSNSTQTLATYMYSQTFMYNNVGYGTAIACAMLVMMLFVIVPYVSFTAKEQ